MTHSYPRRTPRLAPASTHEPRVVPVLARITIHSQSAWPVAADHAGRTVLIVENEDDNRTLMEEILRLAGYRCLTARNGLEALEAFDHERPDIVLTDISMPVMDGLEEVASI